MTDWLWNPAYVLMLLPGLFVAAVLSVYRARRDEERQISETAQYLAELESEWRPIFRHGVHEYQAHTDGRRRAVRIVANGDCPLIEEWLANGASPLA